MSMITKDKLHKHLKERYEKSGREFSFLSKKIAKGLGTSSHAITYPLLKLESDAEFEAKTKKRMLDLCEQIIENSTEFDESLSFIIR